MRGVLVAIVVVLAPLAVVPAAAQSASDITFRPVAVQAAVQAAVVVGAAGPDGAARSAGSGFFVHPQGLVLTHEDVVKPCLGGEARDCRLEVRLHDSAGDEQALAAAVADHDERRGLVLLRVEHEPATWLRLGTTERNEVGDRVWFVGFAASGTGEATAAEGRVTGLIEGPGATVAGVQTDVAVKDGFTGGPVLDLNGSVAGVVHLARAGEALEGGVVPANLLHDFSRSRELLVHFDPPRMPWPPGPVMVSAKPLLTLVEGIGGGTVSCSARGVDPVQAPLETRGGEWLGRIPPPAASAERPPVKEFAVQLEFTNSAGEAVLVRRYRLAVEKAAAGAAAAQASKSRRAGPRTLADLAKSVKLRARPDMVINEDALSWYSSSLVHDFPPERYDQLSSFEHEETATVYDLVQYGLEMMRPLIDDQPEARAVYDDFLSDLGEILPELRRANLVFCNDDEKWYYRDSVTCTDLLEP